MHVIVRANLDALAAVNRYLVALSALQTALTAATISISFVAGKATRRRSAAPPPLKATIKRQRDGQLTYSSQTNNLAGETLTDCLNCCRCRRRCQSVWNAIHHHFRRSRRLCNDVAQRCSRAQVAKPNISRRNAAYGSARKACDGEDEDEVLVLLSQLCVNGRALVAGLVAEVNRIPPSVGHTESISQLCRPVRSSERWQANDKTLSSPPPQVTQPKMGRW